ncbi:MAG: BREX system ATP-binding protein BrxD [Leptospiraceae bacterium]|nr:BREX system ATP-binding protein BrxD [Leptospiraceae bacterium]
MENNSEEVIIESLRKGIVPEEGHKAFAVGIDPVLNEIQRNLDSVSTYPKKGNIKFLRGNYGCGKTFISKYALSIARDQGFVTSFVVISPNDTQFHNFQVVYHKICQNFKTNSFSSVGVLSDALDRWFADIEDQLIEQENLDYDDPKFDDFVVQRLESELNELLKDEVSQDFLSVVRAYFLSKQSGDIQGSGQLLSWLSGSPNIRSDAKKKAGIKGEIDSKTALIYLKGILTIFDKAGYKGLVIVLDEMETILRERRDVREKSMTGLRQITDAVENFKGSLWLFTGTEDFFDSPKGVKGLQPLHDRIGFKKIGEFVNLKQPQLELKPLKKDRLLEISMRLRDIYPSENKSHFNSKVNDELLNKYVNMVSKGLQEITGSVPRVFIRDLIEIFDVVVQNEDIDLEKELKIPEDEVNSNEVIEDDDSSPYTEVDF